MRSILLIGLWACTATSDGDDPPDTSGTDSHDHTTHEHLDTNLGDSGVIEDGEWLWECTPDWEAGSKLVGTWDAEVNPNGRLRSLDDYTGCQAVFTHEDNGLIDAYIVLLRQNVVQDLSQRHGQPPQPTELLSEPPDFSYADGDSLSAALARGGMAGAFVSRARNLVDDDPGGEHADAFLFKVELGGRAAETRRLGSELAELPDAPLAEVALSGDGEWVILASQATNLDSIAPGPGSQLFARRNSTEATRVDLITIGADAPCVEPQVSHDGRYVVFSSVATTLVSGDDNELGDVFLIDRDPDDNGIFEQGNRSVLRVSSPASGSADGASDGARISADGRFVTYSSAATNLVDGDTNGVRDVFVHDRDTDQDGVFDEPDARSTERVSVSTTNAQGDGDATHPGISDDGRWVVFAADSTAAPLTSAAIGQHIFMRDRTLGTTSLVTHDNEGSPALPGSSSPLISRSGKTLIFVTASTTYDLEASQTDLHMGFAENPSWVEPAER